MAPSKPKMLRGLRLPRCEIPKRDTESIDEALLKHCLPRPFDTETLAAAIQQGCSAEAARHYLKSYPYAHDKLEVAHEALKGFSVLHYAVETNNVELVRALLDHGANLEARGPAQIPILALAIMSFKWTIVNPLEVIKTLLAHGAAPDVIPQDMWMDFLAMPSAVPVPTSTGNNEHSSWCTPEYRRLMAEYMHLCIRYFLYKASQIRRALSRGKQIAVAHKYTELLKVPYMVIGQQYACRLVADRVSAYIGMNVRSPLVFTFAGLSGHGKTELATKMGQFLKVNITNIDCAQMTSDRDIFGSHSGWEGWDIGSQLNNFLTDHNEQRSVVFLDGFDKTDQSVRNSLLLLLDSGRYHDRRTNKAIDCSKTIWILATNLGDRDITRFSNDKMLGLNDEQKLLISFKTSTIKLKDVFAQKVGAPMAGRMRNIAPFYPFDPSEQAVIMHKFLLELADECRKDINTSPAQNHFCRHLHVAIQNDGPLCTYLAQDAYVSELGARSLQTCADEVRTDLFISFTDNDKLVEDDMNEGPLSRYNISLKPITGTTSNEVVVSEDGVTEIPLNELRRAGPMVVDQAMNTVYKMGSFSKHKSANKDDTDDDLT